MTDDFKRQAAIAALDDVHDGMVVGLGTGSTASLFIVELGARVRSGLKIVAIPTSEASADLARQVGIPLSAFADHSSIDVTIDGADEVSPELDLIKGLGGALVREKIVAHASRRVVIIVDEAKLVERLGTRSVIPIEVIPFAADLTIHRLMEWGGQPLIRQRDGRTFISDNSNWVVDWKHGPIDEPSVLEKRIKALTGVVDSGLFCGVADAVIVGGVNGVRRLSRERGRKPSADV